MANFVKIAAKSELPSTGEAREFACGDKMICVANIDGTLTAMDNVCLHRGGPLGQGVADGGKVICPWHGWSYDVRSGAFTVIPTLKVKTYRVQKQENGIFGEV